jgi:DNA mismatch repair protein MutS
LAIARAVVEYIHNNPRLNCRTLFATHYHELTELPNILPRARNFNVAVSEEGEQIVFLHRVVPGGADQSYGVHVAQLAGIPRPVVDRAHELLHHLENQGSDFKLPTAIPAPTTTRQKAKEEAGQMRLFTETINPAVEALRTLDVNELSPLEALTKLYELKRMAGDG